jgi:hypothetical protein
LALKGPELTRQEIEAASRRLAALNLGAIELQEKRLPVTGEARVYVMAKKWRKTHQARE